MSGVTDGGAHDAADDGEECLNAGMEEFSVQDRKGGWAGAYLVARRVEPDLARGVGFDQQSTKWFDRTIFRRVSAREFARRAGTTHKRILAFYEAWNRATTDGLVPPAADLAPHQYVDLPEEVDTPFFGKRATTAATRPGRSPMIGCATSSRRLCAPGSRRPPRCPCPPSPQR